ncbi:unnamed protein product [Danaus chrysippus]|uniref:(African queen) hypothetical protein n=1 Tax=Danaus chrysippus TaxID=151541 RepID=A0A8J2QNA3_9NEOP|nr:unnamed protein product [Danaus chrysippus]
MTLSRDDLHPHLLLIDSVGGSWRRRREEEGGRGRRYRSDCLANYTAGIKPALSPLNNWFTIAHHDTLPFSVPGSMTPLISFPNQSTFLEPSQPYECRVNTIFRCVVRIVPSRVHVKPCRLATDTVDDMHLTLIVTPATTRSHLQLTAFRLIIVPLSDTPHDHQALLRLLKKLVSGEL